MRLIAIIPAAAFALAALPAAAQSGNPATMAPAAEQAAAQETNTTDKLFARLVAQGGRAEVDLAELAEQKSANPAVKEFARLIIHDHTGANEKLAQLAKTADISLPGELDADDRAMRMKLEKLSGAAFDVTYILSQIPMHQEATQLLEWEIDAGQNAPIQQFAAEFLPTVMGHLRRAQVVASELTGQAPLELPPRISRTE